MREIKFRAWHKEKRIMIDNIQNAYDGLYFGIDQLLDLHDIDCNLVSSFSEFLNNDTVEVMQYTGLKDKNGVEIYEGDIVKYKLADQVFDKEDFDSLQFSEMKSEVRFSDGEFYPRPQFIECEDNFYSQLFYDFEVIGNIYENLELLK